MDQTVSGAQPSFPGCVYGLVRETTMPALDYFFVSESGVPFGELDRALDAGLERLYAAKAALGIGEQGPDVTRYYRSTGDLYTLEVGIPARGSAFERYLAALAAVDGNSGNVIDGKAENAVGGKAGNAAAATGADDLVSIPAIG